MSIFKRRNMVYAPVGGGDDIPPPPGYSPAPPSSQSQRPNYAPPPIPSLNNPSYSPPPPPKLTADDMKDIHDKMMEVCRNTLNERDQKIVSSKIMEVLDTLKYQETLKRDVVVGLIVDNIASLVDRGINDETLGLIGEAIIGHSYRVDGIMREVANDLKNIGDKQLNKIAAAIGPALDRCNANSQTLPIQEDIKNEILELLKKKIRAKGMLGAISGERTIKQSDLKAVADEIESNHKALNYTEVMEAFAVFKVAGGDIKASYKISTSHGGRFSREAVDTASEYKEMNKSPSTFLERCHNDYQGSEDKAASAMQVAHYIVRFMRNTEKVRNDDVYGVLNHGVANALKKLKQVCGIDINQGRSI